MRAGLGSVTKRLLEPLGLSPTAIVSFVVFVLGGSLLGEIYPFSRYSMYASLDRRSEAAVPVFLADGKIIEPDRFDRFQGLDPEAIRPIGIPCTLEFRIEEGRRWIGQHAAPPGSEAGPVQFAAGFVILRIGPGGQVTRELRLSTQGTAWRR